MRARRRLRRMSRNARARSIRKARAPRTPPKIAPVLLVFLLGSPTPPTTNVSLEAEGSVLVMPASKESVDPDSLPAVPAIPVGKGTPSCPVELGEDWSSGEEVDPPFDPPFDPPLVSDPAPEFELDWVCELPGLVAELVVLAAPPLFGGELFVGAGGGFATPAFEGELLLWMVVLGGWGGGGLPVLWPSVALVAGGFV
jgi:hypothetical protein